MRIRTWIILVLLVFAVIDYGYHQWNAGWKQGYRTGYENGIKQEPRVWKTLAPHLKID